MTGVVQGKRRLISQLGNYSIQGDSQASNGLAHIKPGKDGLILSQRLPCFTNAGSQTRKDTLFFTYNLMHQSLDAVVTFQGNRWFDIKSLAAGRNVVDKTFQATTVIGPYRQNIAAVAIGNQRFLENSLKALVLQQLVKLPLDPVAFTLETAPQIREFERCRIKDFRARTDTAADLGSQLR